VNQALALLVKIVRKISKRLVEIQKAVVSASVPDLRTKTSGGGLLPTASTSRVEDVEEEGGAPAKKPVEEWQPSVSATIEKELEDAGHVDSELRERQRAMLDSLDLRK
jgi:N-acetyltransferase 10